MYVTLLLIYLGLALQFGNWWTLILAPFLIAFITYRVIRPEERYLTRAFGEEYTKYQKAGKTLDLIQKNIKNWGSLSYSKTDMRLI